MKQVFGLLHISPLTEYIPGLAGVRRNQALSYPSQLPNLTALELKIQSFGMHDLT